MKTTIKILVVLTLMLALLLPWAGTVYAANLTVTKTSDTNDGVCDTDCSLREAISVAANGDTITVPAGTYNLSLGDLDVLVSVTINGSGAGSTIIKQTQPVQRVFETAAAAVNISRVTIEGGQAGAASSVVPTHLHGGGLHNHGVVTLTNVTFTGNAALNIDPANPTSGLGGAVWNAGTMTLINVTIANNTAAVSGAGIGGIAPTLTNTIVANNSPDNCSVAITAGSNNLQFPGTTCGGTIPTADPMLGPLTGGVYPLLAGSPAIDMGTNTGCPPTDEPGTARPQGAACDIGAFEFVPAPTAPMCNGQTATIYVNNQGIIVGGPNNGQPYTGKLNGTAGADVIVGTNGRDEFSARGGNDVVCGRGNNDKLEGGADHDQLFGEGGNDRIFGGGGNDIMVGEGGNDTLTGGPGADRFRGGAGTDTATDFTPAQGDTKTGIENF